MTGVKSQTSDWMRGRMVGAENVKKTKEFTDEKNEIK